MRTLLETDREVIGALRDHWGADAFTATGEVDRKAVARRVFADEQELRWLEALLHPRVRRNWEGQVAAEPNARWLIEIPLLFEKRLETQFDFTVCVTSPSAVVEDRMVRRGFSGAEIEQRRQRQMPLEEKARRADFVLTNAGSLEFLNLQTQRLIALTLAPQYIKGRL